MGTEAGAGAEQFCLEERERKGGEKKKKRDGEMPNPHRWIERAGAEEGRGAGGSSRVLLPSLRATQDASGRGADRARDGPGSRRRACRPCGVAEQGEAP